MAKGGWGGRVKQIDMLWSDGKWPALGGILQNWYTHHLQKNHILIFYMDYRNCKETTSLPTNDDSLSM